MPTTFLPSALAIGGTAVRSRNGLPTRTRRSVSPRTFASMLST